MPFFGRHQRLEERTRWNLVFMFFIFGPLAGLALLSFSVVHVTARWREYTPGEWFWNVVWFDTVGIVLLIGLPAVGWQELKRRRGVVEPPAGSGRVSQDR